MRSYGRPPGAGDAASGLRGIPTGDRGPGSGWPRRCIWGRMDRAAAGASSPSLSRLASGRRSVDRLTGHSQVRRVDGPWWSCYSQLPAETGLWARSAGSGTGLSGSVPQIPAPPPLVGACPVVP